MFSWITTGSERRLHAIRWFLTTAWLLIIASLFYDPWSAALSRPEQGWSPFRISRACIVVQGECLPDQPYPLGTTLFWGLVVPSAIFILLVFGHELWRRICPLSFLSQIPRALGLQRRSPSGRGAGAAAKRQVAKVPPDSWLAKHYGSVQFSWLFVGLCGRILFFNADRLLLAAWLLFTIAAAIGVGWWYGGKAWCQYFCPMAPVQSVYSTPAGLLGRPAHTSSETITQSMCRTVLPDGAEQSACVACQQPCIDIDAERMYWARLQERSFSVERYAYVGLVLGYFFYYYLYAGSWEYYFSGVWARQGDQLASLLSPGFFVFGRAIAVPRLAAVPLTLGLFTWGGWRLGHWLEGVCRSRSRRQGTDLPLVVIRHRLFVLATVLVFNVFFLFAGRPLLLLLPLWLQDLFDLLIVATSSLWGVRAWRRSPDLYSREHLASRFRKQLAKLQLDVGQFLEGRSLSDLNTHEVYVLAKVLPGFTRQKRHEAYKGVVREALEEGYVKVSTSLEMLQQVRRELDISDDEHEQLLEELGVEDPALLDPGARRSLENQIRLSGYRRSLERLIALQSDDALARRSLQRQFAISPQEEALILEGLSPSATALQKAELLLQRLPDLVEAYRALHQPGLEASAFLLALLCDQLRFRKELTVRSVLECLVTLGDDAAVSGLVASLQRLSPLILQELLAESAWRERLPGEVLAALVTPGPIAAACPISVPPRRTVAHLSDLVHDRQATVGAAALVLIHGLDAPQALALAGGIERQGQPGLLLDTARRLLQLGPAPAELSAFPLLEKRAVLCTTDFFRRSWADTLDALADHAEVRVYQREQVITEPGDTCRELLVLMQGAAAVRHQGEGGGWVEHLRPGQVLDELEVLTHATVEAWIVAEEDDTRLLAVPVDCFDSVLERDPDFARRVLELESRQLQRLMRQGPPVSSR